MVSPLCAHDRRIIITQTAPEGNHANLPVPHRALFIGVEVDVPRALDGKTNEAAMPIEHLVRDESIPAAEHGIGKALADAKITAFADTAYGLRVRYNRATRKFSRRSLRKIRSPRPHHHPRQCHPDTDHQELTEVEKGSVSSAPRGRCGCVLETCQREV